MEQFPLSPEEVLLTGPEMKMRLSRILSEVSRLVSEVCFSEKLQPVFLMDTALKLLYFHLESARFPFNEWTNGHKETIAKEVNRGLTDIEKLIFN